MTKKKQIFIISLFISILCFMSYWNSRPKLRINRDKKDFKYIQLYTGVFDWKDWAQKGLGEIPFEQCSEKRCHALKPYSTQTGIEEADGVMVHGPNLWYMPNRKSYKRNPKQIWLYYALESPRGSICSSHFTPNDLDDWFNVTATYKQDSDFVLGYSPVDKLHEMETSPSYLIAFEKHNIRLDKPYENNQVWSDHIFSKKIRKSPVAWFVSHCETASRRENYVRELRRYIEVDIYGKCGSYFKETLPDPCPKGSGPKCFNQLLNSYKFYLSFENSLCDDYISEKYWKLYKPETIFDVNIIPVTRGATEEQFQKVTFNNSYINAYNFSSPKVLGEYLSHLNTNNNEYMEYFNFKRELFEKQSMNLNNSLINRSEDKTIFLGSKSRSPFCKLCQVLHNNTFMESKNNRVWKLSEWFSWQKSCWDEDEARRVPFWFTQFLGFCF